MHISIDAGEVAAVVVIEGVEADRRRRAPLQTAVIPGAAVDLPQGIGFPRLAEEGCLLQRRQGELADGARLDVVHRPAAEGEQGAGGVVVAEHRAGGGQLVCAEGPADRGFRAHDLHLFPDPAVDRRRRDGVGHLPGGTAVFLGDLWIEQAGARRKAQRTLRRRLVDEIGLDQVGMVAVELLDLAINHGAQIPGQAGTPRQGCVGQGQSALHAVIAAAEAELAEAAVQPRPLAAHGRRTQVQHAAEVGRRNEFGIGRSGAGR